MQGPKNKVIIDKNKPLMERMSALESFLEDVLPKIAEDQGRIVKGVQEAINKIQFVNSKTAEVVEAIIGAMGPDFAQKVNETAKSNKLQRDERVASNQKAQLAEMIANNKLKAVDSIHEKTLIVCKPYNKVGEDKWEATPPFYMHLSTTELTENDLKPNLGKKVGDFLTNLEPDHKFEVLELYEVVLETPAKQGTNS